MNRIRSALRRRLLEDLPAGARRVCSRAFVRASIVASLIVAAASLVGCGESVERVQLDAPAETPLWIPPLLLPTVEDGVAHYDLTIGQSQHVYRQSILTDTYSYNGLSVLGPTLRLKKGDSVAIKVTNELDQITTTRWHGADVPAEDDGGPHSTIAPGTTWIADFDVIQQAATIWYHPHAHGSTAEHIYRGAAGMMIIDDDNVAATSLPAAYGINDIPVIVQDRDFTEAGQLDFAIDPGGRGNLDVTLTVNGTIDPFVEVPAGLVRLRLLNASQARVYKLSVHGGKMTKIASDGGYLDIPVVLDDLMLAPGDRSEIIVDVGASPIALVDDTFSRVLELRPNGSTSGNGQIPPKLATIDRITESEIAVDRSFHFDRFGDQWGINGALMDMRHVNARVRFGDTERWTITAETGRHVFHVHQTQFQILSINGEPPPPEDAGWEDSVFLDRGREIVLAARFNSYADNDVPYMYHCHMLDHEDLGMMGQFLVVE